MNRLSWSDLLTNYQQNRNRVQCIVGRLSTAERGQSLGSDFWLVDFKIQWCHAGHTPYKEISVQNQGSETVGNLFMVSVGDYDVELGTKKRGWPFQRYQTFRSTWGRRQGSNNVLFSQNQNNATNFDKHSLLAQLKALKTIFMQNMAENVFNMCQRDICAEKKSDKKLFGSNLHYRIRP